MTTAPAAQSHTIVALSHSDFTAYELDPATGRVLHQFTAANEPHEGIASPDGKTFYAAVPSGPHVVILDATTFKEKGRIESPFFRSSRTNGSASPHGVALTTDGSKLYVGLENADIPGIVVYDTRANRVIRKIDVVLRRPLSGDPGEDRQAVLPDAGRQPRARSRHEDRRDHKDHSDRGWTGRRRLCAQRGGVDSQRP